jgi:hypothetical protein
MRDRATRGRNVFWPRDGGRPEQADRAVPKLCRTPGSPTQAGQLWDSSLTATAKKAREDIDREPDEDRAKEP